MVNEVNIPSLRNYEVSIWTLQDRFLSILKWFNLEQKGQIQEPQITLKDDGTQEFSFTIPKFYKVGNDNVLNPMWHQINEEPLIANMHKLKVIFNKNIGQELINDLDTFVIKLNNLLLDLFDQPFNYTNANFKDKNINEILLIIEAAIEDFPNAESKFLRLKRELNLEEVVLEFLVTSVTENHSADNIMIDVAAEGLAFHELGKIGYKIALSQDDFLNDQEAWFENNSNSEPPQEDIHYWNKKIFGEDDDHLITNWKYRVDMDWSAHSQARARLSNQVYEDEYISSWQAEGNEIVARYVEGLRVKWRSIDVKESNIYNITQTIAETFGVFCRYEYEYDVNYQIIGRTVVYYNNYVRDRQNHLDLTYPYSSSSIQRTTDTSNITTKMYVRAVDDNSQGAETLTIMEVDANKSKEDYLLNFDYLYKIGTITEEQYNEISNYETRLFLINSQLYRIRERIDIVSAELIKQEAKQKTSSDGLQLDAERKLAAEEAKSALTDDKGEAPYEKTFAAIPATDRENYYYIPAPVKGIRENSIHLYADYDMALKKPKESSEIFGHSVVRDEFGEINKIGFSSSSDLRSGWLVCKYDPHLYYDHVIAAWENRAILDGQDYTDATAEIRKLKYWLYGTLVDFARVDETYTDNEYMEAAYCDGIIRLDTHETVFSEVDNSRVVTEEDIAMYYDENTGLVDMTAINDIVATPNLYYNYQYYLKAKTEIINAFNRMMGPALREGYWQPENYHDYGDVYKDEFLLYPHQDGNNRNLTNYEQPDENGYVSFMWDWKKQYDNEEPFIYQSTIDGKMEQHIAINLTANMDLFKDHTKDLTFFYYDLGVLQTIYGIEKKIKEETYDLYTREIDGVSGVDCNALYDAASWIVNQQNNFVNAVSNANRDFEKDTLIKFCNIITNSSFNDIEDSNIALGNISIKLLQDTHELADAYRQTAEEWAKSYMDSYNECKGAYDFYQANWDKLYTALKNTNLIERTIHYGVNPTDTITTASLNADRSLNSICLNAELFTPVLDRTTVNKYCKITVEKLADGSGFQLKFIKTYVDTLLPYYINFDLLSSQGYTSLKNQLDIIFNVTDLIAKRRNSLQLDVQYGWIESLVKNGLRSFTVGSQCELGWIIDADTMLDNDGNVISEPIPVLILTDAKSLDEKTIRYLATGNFDYEYYVGDEVTGIEYSTTPINLHTDMPEYQPFLGYNKVIKDDNETVTNVEIIRLIGVNVNDIIYDIITPNGSIYPKFDSYHYRKVYPRLYFNTLKLKNNSDELFIQLNGQNLKDNEDYYTVSDDRSKGLTVLGVGYYTTLKPHTLYKFGAKQIMINILYTLSNADVAIYLDAIAVMKENAFPKVSYNVELSVLNPEIIKNAYNYLTQIVAINDTDLQLEDVNGYISSITMSLDKPWEDQVEIKNYETKFEDLFSTIVAQTEAMKKSENGLNTAISAFTSNGLIKSYILQNSMRSASLQQLYYGGKLTISENDGILATADNNAGVVAIRGNGIFTATEKDASGEWKWNTGILPSGINANLITAGQLDTNLIRIFSGNDLSFQWDGDGLYAYRSAYDNTVLNSNDEYQSVLDTPASLQARNTIINENQHKLDYKQYVKFDGTGLSLVAENGTFVPKKYTTSEGVESYAYDNEPLQTDIERVKIGWHGLILRNWNGERTLYADPDTGNLILSGTITAKAGQIGAWDINSFGLSNNAKTLILSAGDNNIPPGIFLGTTPMASTFTFGGKTYFEYKDSAGNVYYHEQFIYGNDGNVTPGQFDQSMPFYIKKDNQEIAVTPKYILSEVKPAESEATTQETHEDDLPSQEKIEVEITDTISTLYVLSSANSQERIQIGENQYLTYDNNTSPTAEWYNKLKLLYPQTYSYLVDTVSGIVMEPAEPQPALNTKLKASGSMDAKLTITATETENGDTDVAILGGRVGNFDIKKDGLYDGILSQSKIDTSNAIQHNGAVKYNIGMCICEIQVNPSTGLMTIIHANGSQETFNLAAMDFYKEAVAAAGRLALELVKNGNTVTAYASSGLASTSKSLTVATSSSSGGGSSGGGSSGGCNDACQKSCGNVCVSNCSGCKGGCKSSCTGSCTGTARKGGCFAPGTLIAKCNDELVPIEQLHIGDQIVAYDEKNHQLTSARVIDLMKYQRKQLVELKLSNNKSIVVTTSHPLLTTRGWVSLDLERSIIEHFVHTKKMEIGDEFIALDKEPVILQDIIYYDPNKETDVYNLTLDHYHTFFAEGVAAHNVAVVVSAVK